MTLEKNQILKLTAQDLTHEGLGVCKVEGFPLFVENLLPGEEAQVKVIKLGKSFGYGRVEERLTNSPDRVEVLDPKGTWVGTMPLQHMSYGAQLAFKRQQVKNVMVKIAKLPIQVVEDLVQPTLPAPKTRGYRNKAQIPVRLVKGQVETGFFRKNSHQLVALDNYVIQDPLIDQVILSVKDALIRYGIQPYNEEKHQGDLRHIVVRLGRATGQLQLVLVTRRDKKLPESLVEDLVTTYPSLVSVVQNINPKRTNAILGKESRVLHGQDFIDDLLLGKRFSISSQSFYQVNPEQTEVLYQTAIDLAQLTAEDTVIDAYCGIGTIGLCLADRVKAVYGMEIVEDAIAMAKKNAAQNGIKNAHFKSGSAEVVLKSWQALQASVFMVDPPRKGLEPDFISLSCQMKPERIVYVSCNPATLARDLALYQAGGYQVKTIQPVDMFPYTNHVECVALLSKGHE